MNQPSPEIIVVGASSGGLEMAVELRRARIGDVLVLERSAAIEGARRIDPGMLRLSTAVTGLDFDGETDRWHVHTADGQQYRPRLVVAALGSAISTVPVVGLDGARLDRTWRDGVTTFLGVAVHGFPNLFLTGVNSGVAPTIGAQVGYIRQVVAMMRRTASTRVEVRAATQHEFHRRLHSTPVVPQSISGRGVRRLTGGRDHDRYARHALRRPDPNHFDLTVRADREPAHEYSGPALLDAPGAELPVTVTLSGHPDPIDGRYHWYGRVSAADTGSLPDPGRTQVSLTLPGGAPTAGILQERDAWGNLRIVGIGDPPFPLAPAEIH